MVRRSLLSLVVVGLAFAGPAILGLDLLRGPALASAQGALAPGRASGESELAAPPKALVEAVRVDEQLGTVVPRDARFRDSRDGKLVSLGDVLAGDLPTLLTFNYSNCPSLCSAQLNGLAAALATSRYRIGQQVRVVTIVLAPDEPVVDADRTRTRYLEKLRDLGATVDPAGWTFLVAATPDDGREIQRVADAVGFGYRYIATQREYAHPAAVMALAPSGAVMRYLHGVTYEQGELDETIRRTGMAEPSSSAGFVLACLHWDAAANTRRFGARFMKIVALLFVVVGAVVGGVLVARNRRGPGVNP